MPWWPTLIIAAVVIGLWRAAVWLIDAIQGVARRQAIPSHDVLPAPAWPAHSFLASTKGDQKWPRSRDKQIFPAPLPARPR